MSEKKHLVIIGAGGFGREVYTWALQTIQGGAPWAIKGFLDDKSGTLDGYKYDVPHLNTVADYVPQQKDVFLCAIGEPKQSCA